MDSDPNGTWSWKGFWKVVAAVALVVVTAAVIAVTAGAGAAVIAGAVGVTTATTSTIGTVVATTAVVSGIVAGIGEVANQAMDKGAENINLGSVVTSTSGATLDGAMVGASVFTGGAGKIALTVGRVINSAVTQSAYGASENYDKSKTWQNIGLSAGTTLFASAFMAIPSNPITKPYTTGLIKGAIEYFKLRFKYPKYFD